MQLRKCIILGSILTGIIVLPTSKCFAETVTGINIENNTNINSDYKLDDKAIKHIVDSLPITSVIKETIDKNAGRQILVNNKELSYLIEKNIVSRDSKISATDKGFNVSKDELNIDADMKKSDFLMGVYKAVYGSIDSRPIYHKVKAFRNIGGSVNEVIETSSYRPKGYDGSAKTFTYPEGDFDVYVSPNVKELYLHELVNKSIIKADDVLYDISPTGKDWDNTASPCEGLPQQLGGSFKISGNGSNLTIEPQNTDYFVNEKIKTIDALRYVESILRLTEKDLSEREAKIIAYKYGTSYLLKLPKDIRGTVIYLIAMGVIDFENPGEYGNLYQELNSEFAYKLMYRLSNKSGRKDFTKVTMTADDNYFMDNGFVEQRVNMYSNFDKPVPETESVLIDNSGTENMLQEDSLNSDASKTETGTVTMVKSNGIGGLLKTLLSKFGIKTNHRDFRYASPDDSTPTYAVTKIFEDTENIRYKGVRLNSLAKEVQAKPDKFKEVKVLSSDSGKPMRVQFNVSAPSAVQAVASVDSRITITDGSAKHEGNVNTITQVKANKETISYVSSKELENKISELSIINSKTLKNNKTGDMAVLLTDHKLALVGNTIIRSKGDLVRRINGVNYYNMDIVVPLMTNAFISKIDPAKMYIDKSLPSEKILPVYGSGATPIEFTPVINSKDVMDKVYGSSYDSKFMFNCNLLTRGVSTLIRDFDIKASGKDTTAKVIIDWKYSMPDNQDIQKCIEDAGKAGHTDNPTVKDVAEFLTSKDHTSGALRDWWDNNIGISNALANAMYGSKNNGIQYVKSGYLAPNVYILTDDKNISEEDLVKQVFKDIRYPQGYRSKFMDNAEGTDFVKYLFNGTDPKGKPLQTSRIFHVYRGDTVKGYMNYDNRFIVMPTKAVYRAFDSDGRVTLVGSGSKAGINIKARTITDPSKDPDVNDIGKKVEFNGYYYYIDGYSGVNKHGNFYRLKPLKPLICGSGGKSGSLKKVNNAWTMVSGSKDLIDEFVKERTKGVTHGVLRWDKIPKDNRNLKPNDSWVRGNKRDMNNAQIIIGGKVQHITLPKKSTGVTYGGMKDDDVKTDAKTFTYPTIYVKRTEYAVENGHLILKHRSPFLEQGNVFYSGINNSLISALLDQDTSATRYKDLPDGARVLIDDIMYTKTSEGLTSDPTNASIRTLNEASKYGASAIRTTILKMFGSTSINYSGKSVPISSYIKRADLGDLCDKDLAYRVMFKRNGTLKYLEDKNGTVINKTSEVPENSCINVVFDNNVFFNLIDKRNGVYTLALTTDRLSNGYINDISYFYETLGLDGKDDLFIRLTEKTFKKLERAGEFTHKFKEAYQKALVLDSKHLLKFFLTSLLSYAIVMSWMCFAILHFKIGTNLLLHIKECFGKNNDLDLIRLVTFNVLDLDTELKPHTLFLGNVGMFLLLYYVIERL